MATPLGHILDANTQALWRFDEDKIGYLTRIKDYGSLGLHATASTAARSAYMRDYGPNGEAVRYFNGGPNFSDPIVTNHGTGNNATLLAACKTSLTIEFFILWRTGGGASVITMGASNALVLRVDVLSSGKFALFWEITGADQTMTQTAGVGVVDQVWSHVAITKGADIRFYIDGVHQQTVAKAAEPNGASSQVNLGTNVNVNLGLRASIKDLKFTTREKTAGEIATAAALLNTTFELPVEVDTLCLWRCNETEEIVIDSASNEMTLYHSNTNPPRTSHGLINNTNGKGMQFWNAWLLSNAYGTTQPGKAAAVVAFRSMLLSAFTFECWIRRTDINEGAVQQGIWCWGDPGLTTAAGNFLTVDFMSDGKIQWWSEHATDSDSIVTSTAAVSAGTHHLALRRNASAAGNHSVDMFVDGVHVDTLAGIVDFSGGDGAAQQFFLGYGAGEGGLPIHGYMDDVRFSNIARTDAEILESYRRGIGYDAPTVDSDPVVTVVSLPTLSTDPAVVEVYDAEGLALYQLTCRDHIGAPRYVVYDPTDGFNHPFGGRSTVSGAGTQADPYIFTIYRRGRWPTGITLDFKATAVDSGGNTASADLAIEAVEE